MLLWQRLMAQATSLQYTTLNPLDKGAAITLSNNNLTADTSAFGGSLVRSVVGVAPGEHKYWEVTVNVVGSSQIGVCSTGSVDASPLAANNHGIYTRDGDIVVSNTLITTVAPPAAGDVIGVAYDRATGGLRFYKNGILLVTTSVGGATFPVWGCQATSRGTFNFGPAMAYPIPSGASLITA